MMSISECSEVQLKTVGSVWDETNRKGELEVPWINAMQRKISEKEKRVQM